MPVSINSIATGTPNIVGTYTWANKPSASGATGATFIASDVGYAMFYSDGTRWKPVGGHLILGSGGAAVASTNTTSEETLATLSIPAEIMGVNGILKVYTLWTTTSSANNKTFRVKLGGIGGAAFLAQVVTTTVTTQMFTMISNRNSASSQVGHAANTTGVFGSAGGAVTTATQNTANALDLVITSQKATGTETCTLERWVVELLHV